MSLKVGLAFLLSFSAFFSVDTFSQSKPNVLIINAHPDDESGCAGTVYKIVHELKGSVDLCLVTNGEAGFKYSTLAESIYGVELTDEKVGREHLPRIRKMEMMNAGKIIGLRNIIFLEHLDHRYTTDMNEVFMQAWDSALVVKQLRNLLESRSYDYVFCLLPSPETHGGHKAASVLALRAVSTMKGTKPIILGVSGGSSKDSVLKQVSTLDSVSITKLKADTKPFVFNRSTPFGFNNRLNYRIILNWLVAEHKSQGTVQLIPPEYDLETFWYFDINPQSGMAKTKQLFDDLSVIRYPKKTY